MRAQSRLDRMALVVFTTPVMWAFFAFINIFMIAYILYQEYSINAFDPYPYTFLNLILAVFVAEMDVIIVIAQIVASSRTDAQDAMLLASVQKTDRQTALIAFNLENQIALMRSLEEMGLRETARDQELHTLVREGHLRFAILEKLLIELKAGGG